MVGSPSKEEVAVQMRSVLVAAAVAAGTLGIGAAAARPPSSDPPAGAQISDSLAYVARVPDTAGVVEGKFDKVRGREVLILTGRFGFKTLDVSDPTSPQVLDTYLPPEMMPNGYWQNEDMEIDTRRKLIFGAVDPRHTNVDQVSCPGIGTLSAKTRNPSCRSGFYVISYADPEDLTQIGPFMDVPAGHTVSCIEKCDFLWIGGPARRNDQAALGPFTPGGRGDGRPVWVADAANPFVYPQPVDLWRNDGFTDYSHDVDVDGAGIAWTSGRGGALGYATHGRWRDPRTGEKRKATPWDPVLVAGGGVEGGPDGVAQPQTDFIHNSSRPLGGKIWAEGVKNGNVILMTEEDFTGPCSASGRIVAADITDSLGGEPAANSTPESPYRMDALSAYHPTQDAPDTTGPSGSCSAHYFEIAGSTVAAAWYGQGLRLIDASDARNLRQVGYYYVTGTDPATNPSSLSWDVAWRGNLIFLFDMSRGVEILRMDGGPDKSSKLKTVVEPRPTADPLALQPAEGLTGEALVCPIFK
jgi:hypothetical protein